MFKQKGKNMNVGKFLKVGQVEIQGDYPAKIVYSVLAIWAIKSLFEVVMIFLFVYISGNTMELGLGTFAFAKFGQMIRGIIGRKKIDDLVNR